jgi:hypothetical protein
MTDRTQLKVQGGLQALEKEVAKGQIVQAALANLRGRPGFNPASFSLSFSLSWEPAAGGVENQRGT